jgi:hypothetical protein
VPDGPWQDRRLCPREPGAARSRLSDRGGREGGCDDAEDEESLTRMDRAYERTRHVRTREPP